MMTILPADIYLVTNKSNLNEKDRQILNMLYQPIIGFEAVSLYLTLWSDLDKCNIMSNEYTHHHLMNNMKLPLKNIVDLRKKLEAIGLLKSYFKKGNTNNYVYEIYAPISEYEFFNHPILSVVLYNNLGEKEYKRLTNFFKAPQVNLKNYENITATFKEVFDIKPETNMNVALEEIRKKEKIGLNLADSFDFEQLKELLGNLISKNTLNKTTKELIKNLSLIYAIDETQMANIIKVVIDEKGLIDKEKLRKETHKYYKFEQNGKMPTIIKKTNDSYKGEIISKKDKLIYTFETTSPYDFLVSKYDGHKPTARDMNLLESLIVEHGLKPGVINVLVDYVLKVNNQKLSKPFIETIAGQWKRLKIETARDAMEIAGKEHKKRKTYKKTVPKVEKVPEWFNEKIDKLEASKEELDELDELLSKY